jgi:hypothetical protein
MRELVQIDSISEHACGQPSIQRWEVLEPITGRWSWMRVFGCCDQIVVDIDASDADGDLEVQRAA